jgi:hypothetical protein
LNDVYLSPGHDRAAGVLHGARNIASILRQQRDRSNGRQYNETKNPSQLSLHFALSPLNCLLPHDWALERQPIARLMVEIRKGGGPNHVVDGEPSGSLGSTERKRWEPRRNKAQ